MKKFVIAGLFLSAAPGFTGTPATEHEALPEGGKTSMDALYATLEKERSSLRQHLDRLRYEVNRRKWEPDVAKEAVSRIGGGYHLLKHPPLRAAFSSEAEIRRELERVRKARRRLDALERILTKEAGN